MTDESEPARPAISAHDLQIALGIIQEEGFGADVDADDTVEQAARAYAEQLAAQKTYCHHCGFEIVGADLAGITVYTRRDDPTRTFCRPNPKGWHEPEPFPT